MVLIAFGLGISIYFAYVLSELFRAFMLLKISPLNYLKISLLIAMATFFYSCSYRIYGYLWHYFHNRIHLCQCFRLFFICVKRKSTRTNEVSALMIMGVSGGAIILPLQGIINDHFGFFISLFILLICLVLIFIFTLKLDKNVQE